MTEVGDVVVSVRYSKEKVFCDGSKGWKTLLYVVFRCFFREVNRVYDAGEIDRRCRQSLQVEVVLASACAG